MTNLANTRRLRVFQSTNNNNNTDARHSDRQFSQAAPVTLPDLMGEAGAALQRRKRTMSSMLPIYLIACAIKSTPTFRHPCMLCI